MTFADVNAVDTTATFSVEGVYVLRLAVDDSDLTASDEVTVTVDPPVNHVPIVDAGITQTVALPAASANLDGTVIDDGLPDPPNMVTTTWSAVSGPGAVTFADTSVVDTTASFTIDGIYVLQLTADDSELTASDEVIIIVNPVNTVPIVDAGANQAITLPSSVNLDGAVSDDGLPNPPGVMTTTWSMDSGPGTVTFGDASVVDTTASFSLDGVYVLRLTADDGQLTASDVMTVTVSPVPNQAPVVDAGLDQAITLPNNISLNGTVTDDGLPNPPGVVTTTWSMDSGPGVVTFGDASIVSTTASFSVDGVYVLQLMADDGQLTASDVMTVTVNPVPNQAPLVDAGANQVITLPAAANLDGTVSDDGLPDPPNIVTTTWSLDSGPGTVTFADASFVDTTATFSVDGVYVLRLTADDGQLTASDMMTVTVSPSNVAPVVDAGADQAITLPSSANLDGTVTDDGLPNPPSTVTTTWSMNSGPGTVTFNDASLVDTTATFSVDGVYVLRLTADDGQLTASDVMTVTVSPVPNQAPVVDAGADQAISLPDHAVLSGTVGDDGLPNPPSTVTTTWSLDSGPGTVTFADASMVNTTASFAIDGTYVLRLTADDSQLTTSDMMTVTVSPANSAPVVDAGADQTITLPANAVLSGTVSDDGFPNPPNTVTTTWSMNSGPGVVTFGDTSVVATTASFSVDGTYVLRLTADDGQLTASDEVTITVQAPVAPTIIQVSVNSSADDAEEVPNGNVNLTSSDLEMIFEKRGDQIVGMRFNNIDIPQGAVIANAYIQFQVDETPSDPTFLTIRGQAIDDAPAFTTANSNISSRVTTAATVNWNPPPWPTKGAAGPDQQTTNIATVIEEIVNRPGWVSGNSLALIITGTGERVAESFNGDQAGAPMLRVEYYATGQLRPVVNAGPDQTVNLNSATLDGTVTDDGLPDPPGAVTTLWTVVSGPGGVTFAEATAVDTTVTFPTVGVYTLRLTADDGALTANDDIVVTYTSTQNPPSVNAGIDQTITLPDGANLDGTVTDDGLPDPPGEVTTLWTVVNGPGGVTFGNATAVDTTATFAAAGVYTLRLTADDGELIASDDINITVAGAGGQVTIDVQVSGSTDDAEEDSVGDMDLTSSDLELVFDKGEQTVGIRFNGLDIPQGATITNATIQFTTDEKNSTATSLIIQGEDSDNTVAFSNADGDISARPKTTAAVAWSPPGWNVVGEAGPDQQTPNIAAVIQEIVNRPNWLSGNSLVIIITGTGERAAESYNGQPSGAPSLHIEYTIGSNMATPSPDSEQARATSSEAHISHMYLNSKDVALKSWEAQKVVLLK